MSKRRVQDQQTSFRTDEETMSAIKKRAWEKNLTINEWLNRAAKAGLLKGGKITITSTETLEY